jgi:acetyl-CoA C-acetyltransferase
VTDAWIVSTARTAIGTAFKGTLIDVDPIELGTVAVAEAVRRSGIDPLRVDDVVLAESRQGGGDIARHVAIRAGLVDAPGLAHNRHCAGGLAAITTAAATVKAGMDEVVVAGGVQSASTAPRQRRRVLGTADDFDDWAPPSHPETPDAPCEDMSITVGWNAAVQADVSREAMDAWACRSHERAVAAIDAGLFTDEIVPIAVTRRDGAVVDFRVDEHPRRDTSMEKLASLKPIHPEIDGFSITAGNASGVNDGAAAVVVAAPSTAYEPLAVVRAWASVGVPPADTGLAPVKAIPKALARAGLDIDDVDLWEINEAFASMCVGTVKLLGLDESLVNVLGSGCSLGHPIAMTGARMVISLTHELRRRGGGVGVAAMCAGGGMSTAVVLDVPA